VKNAHAIMWINGSWKSENWTT